MFDLIFDPCIQVKNWTNVSNGIIKSLKISNGTKVLGILTIWPRYIFCKAFQNSVAIQGGKLELFSWVNPMQSISTKLFHIISPLLWDLVIGPSPVINIYYFNEMGCLWLHLNNNDVKQKKETRLWGKFITHNLGKVNVMNSYSNVVWSLRQPTIISLCSPLCWYWRLWPNN